MRTLFAFIALAVIQCSTTFAAEPSFPWKKGDLHPPIAGVSLGGSRDQLRQILGEPSQVHEVGDGGLVLFYKPKGLIVLWTAHDGAAIIYLATREAADVGGVRLGDTAAEVIARWGIPSSFQGDIAIYRAGSWGVVVRADSNERVRQLGLGNLSVVDRLRVR